METFNQIVWKADIAISATEFTGTANAWVFTPATAATEYAFGDSYTFTAEDTNTGAVTVNISAVASEDVQKRYGGVVEALAAGDVREGGVYRIYFDGTRFLLSPEHGALLPSDFLEQRSLYLDSATDKQLAYYPPEQLRALAQFFDVARPKAYAIEGDWAVSLESVDSTYFARLTYYRRFTALSGASDTNWLLTYARGIYLFAALTELALFTKDDAAALTWAMRYEDELEKLHAADQRDRHPRGKTVIRHTGMVA